MYVSIPILLYVEQQLSTIIRCVSQTKWKIAFEFESNMCGINTNNHLLTNGTLVNINTAHETLLFVFHYTAFVNPNHWETIINACDPSYYICHFSLSELRYLVFAPHILNDTTRMQHLVFSTRLQQKYRHTYKSHSRFSHLLIA